MSCRWCVYWVPRNGERYADKEGECRRYPKPETTKVAYRCGEFVCQSDYWDGRDSSLMEGFYHRMHEYLGDYEREKAERIRLQKELKRIRAIFRKAGIKP